MNNMVKELITELIDNNKVISFDVFDTLLLRNIYRPTDIFRILDKIAFEKYGISSFYDIRISSEKESRNEDNHYECHIDDIYNIVSEKITNKKVASELKKEELFLEEEFLVVNPFIKEIYDYCDLNKKEILFISDMYLDEKFIMKILKKFGYKKFTLYLSNTHKRKKGDMSLYEFACSDKGINKDDWLHIGDNGYSDYEMPIKFGIEAFHYKGVYNYVDNGDYSIFESIILGIQNNYLYNGFNHDYWESFGVKNVSTIYFGFTKWLYDLTRKLDNLFFIARDGYIIEKIYDMFNVDKIVHTNYLYCSRKSLIVPSLYTLESEDMVNLLSCMYVPSVECTLRDFLIRCEVDVSSIDSKILYLFELDSLDVSVTSDNFRNVKKLLAFLSSSIKNKLKKDYELVFDYLKQEGVDDFSLVNVMDVGWAGSIQSSIQRVLSKRVNGYYFGTVDTKIPGDFSTKFGYYFDLGYKNSDMEDIMNNVMMYELIFSAPHGSTIGYERKSGKVVPIMDNNADYNEIISKFQNSAIDIIGKYLEYLKYFDYLSKEFCTSSYRNFINDRRYEDVVMFSKLSNDFALGNDSKFNYVNKVDNNILSDNKKFLELSEASLWPFTFIADDNSFNRELYLNYKSQLFTYFGSLYPLSYAKLYLDYGNGFNEGDTVFVPFEFENDIYSFKYRFDCDRKIYQIRIDPVEGKKIVLKELSIVSNLGDVSFTIPHKKFSLTNNKNEIVINSVDPKIIINTLDINYILFKANIKFI